MSRLAYSFAAGAQIDGAERVALLGGKGAALARMTAMGLPVPPGFTITTGACRRYLDEGWFDEVDGALTAGIAELSAATGRSFGPEGVPLLVSVRSGAPVSMPGMMDTVLNVGMSDEVAAALGEATADAWFGFDTQRRFVQSYSTVVLGAPGDLVGRHSAECLGADEGRSLDPDGLRTACAQLQERLAGDGFVIPEHPVDQVRAAVGAVFASWRTDRAVIYREVEGIDATVGTAATVQLMTFGNLGDRSGTGVAFSRDPSTGEHRLVGDFLTGAQGEDVVAGTHATQPVAALGDRWPDLATQLHEVADVLERDIGDLADIEFTIEDGTLWLLQVRRGKHSPRAALRMAIDMAEDPDFPLERAAAVERVADILLDPPTRSDGAAAGDEPPRLAAGLAASPGRAIGALCIDIEEAVEAGARHENIILVRRETSPADIAGMAVARGLVTTLGGLVSHAAVVARGWGVPAVVGAGEISVWPEGITVGDQHVAVGETLTIDGDLGAVYVGAHPGAASELDEVAVLRRWQEELSAPSTVTTAAAVDDGEAATKENCERVLALKGMGTADSVAAVLGCAPDAVAEVIAQLQDAGEAQEFPGDRVRLLPDAIARVDARYATDAERLAPVIEPQLDAFHTANDAFKQVITDWQMRDVDGETVPNDHDDADYDADVLARLEHEIHPAILPVLAAVVAEEARFGRYRARFEAALHAIAEGDQQMVAHPLRESYHTVWFELHEELIRLSGRNRADEAAAGRG